MLVCKSIRAEDAALRDPLQDGGFQTAAEWKRQRDGAALTHSANAQRLNPAAWLRAAVGVAKGLVSAPGRYLPSTST